MALLDLAGRSCGLPLVDLIGGAVRRKVAPMWLLGNPTPEQDIAEAHAKRAEGFGFFKLKIGTKPVDAEIAATLALREALGAAMPLCADANCGLDFADAQRYVDGTRAAGLMFVEQPLAHDDLSGARPADAPRRRRRSAPTRASTRSPISRRMSAAASAASRSSSSSSAA